MNLVFGEIHVSAVFLVFGEFSVSAVFTEVVISECVSTVFLVSGDFSMSTVYFFVVAELYVSSLILVFGEFSVSAVLLVISELCELGKHMQGTKQTHMQKLPNTRNTADAQNSPNTAAEHNDKLT